MATVEYVPVGSGPYVGQYIADTRPPKHPGLTAKYDWSTFVAWRTNCDVLACRILQGSKVLQEMPGQFRDLNMSESNLEFGIARVEALRDNWQAGLLHDLRSEIQAEIGSDYLATAEKFLQDGQHGIAGMLACVVLEHAIHSLCEQQNPPLSLEDSAGRPIKADTLIDSLKTAGVFAKVDTAQCRGWLAVRTHCAHAQWDQVRPDQVDTAINGIRDFLARHLL